MNTTLASSTDAQAIASTSSVPQPPQHVGTVNNYPIQHQNDIVTCATEAERQVWKALSESC